MADLAAKKPVGILAGIIQASAKKPAVASPAATVPEEPGSSPELDDETVDVSPEEKAALGDTLATALKGGDGASLYDAVEAIVRSCKGEY
jgi:hypothetical protein